MNTHFVSRPRSTPRMVVAAALLAFGAAGAEAAATGAMAAPARAESIGPEQVESLTAMLAGSWKTEGAAGDADNAGLWMHITPVNIEGLANAMYVEQARADDPGTPYRQAVFQAYLNRGKLRLRTLDMRVSVDEGGPWALAWLAPESFPAIDPDGLIATLDLEFKASGDGFEGRTPHPYPNADAGAVEMTSEMKIAKDALVTSDKGYGPDGAVVWGGSTGDSLTWRRADPGFKVKRDDDGLIIITVSEAADGAVPVDGDTIFVDYSLWLADGTPVDSSAKAGRLMPVPVPMTGARLIAGYIRGLEGASEGTVRRLIIPPALGYGEAARGPMPANSVLYFRVEIAAVQKPVVAEPEDGAAPAGGGH